MAFFSDFKQYMYVFLREISFVKTCKGFALIKKYIIPLTTSLSFCFRMKLHVIIIVVLLSVLQSGSTLYLPVDNGRGRGGGGL